MAEYWKSTPKYWCKFCSLYVKDTKFERANHEATGRHQGNIQRSLKGLHREQENQARQKQRAKDEVARLNGLVPGPSSGAAAAADGKPTFVKQEQKKATLEDRKRQWSQLAAMGIAVPGEARAENAMAGEWSVVSEQVVGEVDEEGGFKPVLNKGVLKRKLSEGEEERIKAGEMITKKKGWGQTYKSFPGKMASGEDDDVEALFSKVKKSRTEVKAEAKEEGVKEEDAAAPLAEIPTAEEAAAKEADASVKEEDTSTPKVVFKKRKKIAR